MKGVINTRKSKRKGNSVKQILLRINAWLHLWPSIVSGIVVVFVCLTGTLIVYADEILEWTAGGAKYVEPEGQVIPTGDLVEEIFKSYELRPEELVFYRDPSRSFRLRSFNPKDYSLNYIYINQYTGDVLKVDKWPSFFFITAHLHSSLLGGKIGGAIVIVSTIIFSISCLTGLVLWWPKRWTKTTRKASFTIKWKASFKRLNYDLHNVYGFYSLGIALLLSITGIIIYSHGIMKYTISTFGGGEVHAEEVIPPNQQEDAIVNLWGMADQVFAKAVDRNEASIWLLGASKTGAYVFKAGKVGLRSVENMRLFIFNKYSGEAVIPSKDVYLHEEIENKVWQLHMGQFWGQLGKLSTFLAGVISTSLPITGFIIYLNRKRKKTKPRLT